MKRRRGLRFGGGAQKGAPDGQGRLTRRAALVLGGQAAAMGALGWQMRTLQIEEGDRYRMLAEENRINIRLIAPARGQIFDRSGQPVAINRQNFKVVIIREQARDVEEVLDRLGLIVPVSEADRERALRELSQKAAFVPVTIAEHLSWEQFAQVNANAPALPGIVPEVGLTRLYPEGETLSHVVGHVGPVSGSDIEAARRSPEGADPLLQIPDFQIGKNGVERLHEAVLRGTAGERRIEINAAGRQIRELDREPPEGGKDLALTIDLGLQRYAMRRMAGESAATVVMDIDTGDLLCMASAPGFDPNKFVLGVSHADWNAYLEDEYRPLANKTVSGQYPPGSTFKMVVALAALENGLATPGETVFCNGGTNLGRHRFHCWKRGGHGHMDCRSAIKESCDVYFYDLARRCGPDLIAETARRFGLGIRHDLPLTAIREGLMPTRQWKRANRDEGWQVGDSFNFGIGQGFSLATPLQLCVMSARLAAGRSVVPRLVRRIGGEAVGPPEAPELGISRSHLALVRDAMSAVMNEQGGTARGSRIHDPAGRMAGKTGTSQVRRITMAERARGVLRDDQLPWNRRNHALFVAFAPAEAPRYALATIVEHGGGGSRAAAPIARDVMMHALWGEEPPLSAYPPGERDAVAAARAAAAAERAPAPDGSPRDDGATPVRVGDRA
jgi:penicillin-binding protein 2